MSPNHQGEFLPNLFVLGAAKCGTTLLHAYLDGFSGVCMSNPKEPFFFESEYQRGLDHYRERYFPHWNGEPFIGESRHRNLYLPYVAERIRAVNPAAKLIVLVRNPVDRAFSHWWHWHYAGREKLGFREAIREDWERIRSGKRMETAEEIEQHCRHLGYEGYKSSGYGIYRTYLDSAYYFEQIERYLSLFPEHQLKVFLFEDLVSRPAELIAELAGFLGLEEPAPRSLRAGARNARRLDLLPEGLVLAYQQSRLRAKIPERVNALGRSAYQRLGEWLARRRSIDPQTRLWLVEHYLPHNEALARFLGKDLAHWSS